MILLCFEPASEGIEHGVELPQNTRDLLSASNQNLCNFTPETFGAVQSADPISVFGPIFVAFVILL